jgi:hypothetical protein
MWRARNPDNPRSVAAQNKQSTQRFVPFPNSANKLDVVADFVCEIFVEFCQSAGSLFQLRCQGQYALDRFPIAYPPREVAYFFSISRRRATVCF